SDVYKRQLIMYAQGDARRLLNALESAAFLSEGIITADIAREAIQRSVVSYDRAGDRHYDTISAFIKSLRGSDPDAALLYLAHMLEGGEDPLFIARRMVIFASEDIGNAVPQALNLAVSALVAVQNIGMPEAEIILGHCATYLASAPKSNAAYKAIKAAKDAVAKKPLIVPLHLRNAPTGLAKHLGYGRDYRYPHDYSKHFIEENYFPDGFEGMIFYKPTEEGAEKAIAERLRSLWRKRYEK
ncbi:MAG: replication-associated recombination protein A, partial [Spirochaetes bacterium]|nr:replication-associated recombination protein A [Spirochaetota bacterium]